MLLDHFHLNDIMAKIAANKCESRGIGSGRFWFRKQHAKVGDDENQSSAVPFRAVK